MKKLLVLICALLLSSCGYNTLQTTDEQVRASWSEVLSQYQRRADLVPNLVETVKGYASHERDVLTRVTEARSRVGAVQATPELVGAQLAAICRQMEGRLAHGRYEEAVVEGIRSIARVLAAHVPARRASAGRMPDQPVLIG